MIIDVDKVEKALFQGKAGYAADRLGLKLSRVQQYRQRETAKSYRNWENMKLSEAIRIMKILNREEKLEGEDNNGDGGEADVCND